MRPRFTGVCLVTATVLASCGLPSDVSDEFTLELPDTEVLLTLGDTVRMYPTLSRGSEPASGFELAYSSDAPEVALVDDDGLVRAVGIGNAVITVFAANLQNATPDSRTVRVLSAVTIDTVIARSTFSPDGRLVRWGEIIDILGVGLDPDVGNTVFIGDVPARFRDYVAAPSGDPDALDRLSVWVPVGAPEDADVLVSRQGGSTATWPLRVDQRDVVESSLVIPIDLSEPFYVPELALEVEASTFGQPCVIPDVFVDPEDCYSDGYSVTIPESGSVTIELDFDQSVISLDDLVEIQRQEFDGVQARNWSVTPFRTWCLDIPLTGLLPDLEHPSTSASRSWTTVVSGPPGSPVWIWLAQFGNDLPVTPNPYAPPETMRYGMRITPSYVSSLAPDGFEPNSDCLLAQPLTPGPAPLSANFDGDWDHDWFSFRLPGLPTPAPTVVAESEPNGALAEADTISLGTRVTAEVAQGGDVDYFAFFADTGDLLDLAVRTPFETGESTLDSYLQLYFDGAPIASNNNAATGNRDSRILHRAQETGWYTASVQQLNPLPLFLDQTYTFTARALDTGIRRVSIEVTNPDGLPESDFDPTVALFIDERANGLSSPIGLLRQQNGLEEFLEPGEYLILIHNRVGKPANYQFTLTSAPVG